MENSFNRSFHSFSTQDKKGLVRRSYLGGSRGAFRGSGKGRPSNTEPTRDQFSGHASPRYDLYGPMVAHGTQMYAVDTPPVFPPEIHKADSTFIAPKPMPTLRKMREEGDDHQNLSRYDLDALEDLFPSSPDFILKRTGLP